MKNKPRELDVDFIGVQHEPLTKAEELAITAFIRMQREKRHLQTTRKSKTKQPKKLLQPI